MPPEITVDDEFVKQPEPASAEPEMGTEELAPNDAETPVSPQPIPEPVLQEIEASGAELTGSEQADAKAAISQQMDRIGKAVDASLQKGPGFQVGERPTAKFNVALERLRAWTARNTRERLELGGRKNIGGITGFGSKWGMSVGGDREIPTKQVIEVFSNMNDVLDENPNARPITEYEWQATEPALRQSKAGRNLLARRKREQAEFTNKMDQAISEAKTVKDARAIIESASPAIREWAKDRVEDKLTNTITIVKGKKTTLKDALSRGQVAATKQEQVDRLNMADGLDAKDAYAWRVDEDTGKIWKPSLSAEQEKIREDAEKEAERQRQADEAEQNNRDMYDRMGHRVTPDGPVVPYEEFIEDERVEAWEKKPDGKYQQRKAPTAERLKELNAVEKEQRRVDYLYGDLAPEQMTSEELGKSGYTATQVKWIEEKRGGVDLSDEAITRGRGDYEFAEGEDSVAQLPGGELPELARKAVKEYDGDISDAVSDALKSVKGLTKGDYIATFKQVLALAEDGLNSQVDETTVESKQGLRLQSQAMYNNMADQTEAFDKEMTDGADIGYATSIGLNANSSMADIQNGAIDGILLSAQTEGLTSFQLQDLESGIEELKNNPSNRNIHSALREAYNKRVASLQSAVTKLANKERERVIARAEAELRDNLELRKSAESRRIKQEEAANKEIAMINSGMIYGLGDKPYIDPETGIAAPGKMTEQFGYFDANDPSISEDDWDLYRQHIIEELGGTVGFDKVMKAFNDKRTEWEATHDEEKSSWLGWATDLFQKESESSSAQPALEEQIEEPERVDIRFGLQSSEEKPAQSEEAKADMVRLRDPDGNIIRVSTESVDKALGLGATRIEE